MDVEVSRGAQSIPRHSREHKGIFRSLISNPDSVAFRSSLKLIWFLSRDFSIVGFGGFVACYQFTQQSLPACKPVLTPAWVSY